MEPEFIDNFLGKKEFGELQDLLMGEMLPWYYRSIIDYAEDVNKFQFVHTFYENMISFLFCEKLIFNIPISGFFDLTTFPPTISPNNWQPRQKPK